MNIFSYRDFREVVKDWLKKKKMSIRDLAKELGTTSLSYTHNLVKNNGHTMCSQDTVVKLSNLMSLNKTEELYFRVLVDTSQSKILTKQQKSLVRTSVYTFTQFTAKKQNMDLLGTMMKRDLSNGKKQ